MTFYFLFLLFHISYNYCFIWNESFNQEENCICAIKEQCCKTSHVDEFNSKQFFPVMQVLIKEAYFRYYKVNTDCKCSFWDQESMCSIRNCAVDRCSDDELPDALKSDANNKEEAVCAQGPHIGLDTVDKTISLDRTQFFESVLNKEWEDNQYCDLGDNEPAAQYVDLPLNPERFTGYSGRAANIIWEKLYEECKECDDGIGNQLHLLNRIVSGMHTSVNIHLCSLYPLEGEEIVWDFNYECFIDKFLTEFKIEKSSEWFRNLYFLYSIITRAILKAEGIWKELNFSVGSENEDIATKKLVAEVINMLKTTSFLFNEESIDLEDKKDFIRIKFLNASRLMDCVACEKCKLWGKLQTQGIGTALKILLNKESLILSRNEIVSLFNAAARYSTSLEYLSKWKSFVEYFVSTNSELKDEL